MKPVVFETRMDSLKAVNAAAPATIRTACKVSVYMTAARPPVIVRRAVIKMSPMIDT